MIKIYDGRSDFYQWDLDRKIVLSDPSVTEVHFCNKTSDCSLVVEVKDGIANVPNILLQTDWTIRVYAYCGDCYTKEHATFKVIARSKPDDYVYTETEIKTWNSLKDYVDEEIAAIPKEVVNITNIDDTYETVKDLPTETAGNGDTLLVSSEKALYSFDATSKEWTYKRALKPHTLYCVLKGENSGIYRYTNAKPYLILAEQAAISKANAYTDKKIDEALAGGGGGGTGVGKLYRHDIEISSQAWVGSIVYECFITIYDGNSNSYAKDFGLDINDGYLDNPATVADFPFLSKSPTICGGHYFSYDSDSEGTIYAIHLQNDNVMWFSGCEESIFINQVELLKDTVTEIPITGLPNLDVEVF